MPVTYGNQRVLALARQIVNERCQEERPVETPKYLQLMDGGLGMPSVTMFGNGMSFDETVEFAERLDKAGLLHRC